MSLFAAAYDISDSIQRAKVASVLSEYGDRVQRSVFVVWIEQHELPTVRRRVGALLSDRDQFDLFPIDPRASRNWVSWQRRPDGHGPVILA